MIEGVRIENCWFDGGPGAAIVLEQPTMGDLLDAVSWAWPAPGAVSRHRTVVLGRSRGR